MQQPPLPVPLYVALFGTAPSRMGHPHHDSLHRGTHVLVPKAMEAPQTSLSRSNPSAMLGQRRSPLPSCGEIRTVEDLGASNSPDFTATHEWGGQFQHGSWHLTHRMPRKRPIYYDELDEVDHTHLFKKSASFLPAVLLSPFSAWSKAFESS